MQVLRMKGVCNNFISVDFFLSLCTNDKKHLCAKRQTVDMKRKQKLK